MKLNEMQIAALEAKGFNRWTKGTMDRLYINANMLGLELDYYKTGNISSAYWQGERISNRQGGAYKYAKTYINIETGNVHGSIDALREAAEALMQETLSEDV